MGKSRSFKLKPGDRVRIRGKQAILQTLDSEGRLEHLPFMPQMFEYCGQEFSVFRRAHKTCDTVHGTGGRRMMNAVHLDTPRCDGSAFGGCEAGCLLFWKHAWLEKIDGNGAAMDPAEVGNGCTEETVWKGTMVEGSDGGDGPTFTCQATELPKYTELLKWWDIRQYIEDYRSGNVGLREMFGSLCYSTFNKVLQFGVGYRSLLWLYDRFQRFRRGVPYPNRPGVIPKGQPTPVEVLNLQPGELVRVKSLPEILETLDTNSKNRGLYFDMEEVPYCGGVYRVLKRCNRIVDERTGKLIRFKTDSVILENVYCRGSYSENRLFCPRAIYSMWREIWLERVNPAAPPKGGC